MYGYEDIGKIKQDMSILNTVWPLITVKIRDEGP